MARRVYGSLGVVVLYLRYGINVPIGHFYPELARAKSIAVLSTAKDVGANMALCVVTDDSAAKVLRKISLAAFADAGSVSA